MSLRARVGLSLGLLALAVGGFFILKGPSGEPASSTQRRQAPEFRLPGAPGAPVAEVSLESLQGHAVLVHFWASWCQPCRAEHARLEALQAQGVTILGVNYKDKPDDARAFLDDGIKQARRRRELREPGGEILVRKFQDVHARRG
mgnify:CR=1 FL=1